MGIVFRQSLKGSIVNLAGAFIGFLTTFFVITHLLTPEEIGLTRVLVEAATLVGGYALLASNTSIVRYYPYFHTDDGTDDGFFRIVLAIPLFGIFIFGGLYLLLREPLVNYFAPDEGTDLFRRYYLVVLPLMVFSLYQTLLEVYCSLKSRITCPKLSREVILRLLLLVCYLLYGLKTIDFDHFILLFVFSYGMVTIITFGYAIKITPNALRNRILPVSDSVRRDFRHYTVFTLLSALGSSIIQRLDLFMVSSELGMAHAGIYSIAFYVVAVIEMPARSLSAMSSPIASQVLHQEDYQGLNILFRKVSNNQLLLGMILLVIIWVNIDTLFTIIPNGHIYAQGKWVVLFLGIGKLIDLSFSFGNAILRYSKHYYWTLAYTIIVLAVTILLNLYFISKWGISGAAIATMITLIVSYAFQQIVLWRKLQVSPLNREMWQILLIFVILMGTNWVLPHTQSLLFDSVWRTITIAFLGWLLLRSLPTFKRLIEHFDEAFRQLLTKYQRHE